MGNYEQLKQSVSDVIKTNGNQEITGSILQNVLLTIISSVGANATFAGMATPTTNPGTPDGPVFYLASKSGTYTNFNAIELQAGLSVLMWNGSWNSQQIFSIDNEPTAGSENLVKSGGVFKEDLTSQTINSSYKIMRGIINSSNQWDTNQEYFQHIIIPINPGDTIRVDIARIIAFLTDYNGVTTAPSFCSTSPYDGRIINNKQDYIAPNDARYLFIETRYQSDVSNMPTGIYINGYYNELLGLVNSVTELNEVAINCVANSHADFAHIKEFDGVIDGGNHWKLNGKHVVVSVNPNDKITVYGGNVFAVLRDYKPFLDGETPMFSTDANFSSRLTDRNTTYIMPSDAKYFVIVTQSGETRQYFYYIRINGYDITRSLSVNINNIVDNIDSKVLNERNYFDYINYGAANIHVGIINSSNQWDVSQDYLSHFVVPISPSDTIRVDKARIIAFLTSYDGTATAPSFCSASPYNERITNNKKNYVAPSDAKFLYVETKFDESIDNFPTEISINGYNVVKSLSNNLDSININSDYISRGIGTRQRSGIINANNQWDISQNYFCHIIIPINAGDAVKVRGSRIIAFLRSYNGLSSQPDFSQQTGFTNRIVNPNGSTYVAPNDAKFLFVETQWQENIMTIPTEFTINGYDVLSSITSNYAVLEEKINNNYKGDFSRGTGNVGVSRLPTDLSQENKTIFDFNPDEEFFNKINQLKRFPRKKTQVYYNNTPVVLAHFSDIHGQGTELSRIVDFCTRYDAQIDDILFTGDAVQEHIGHDYTFWTNLTGAHKILFTVGNHDGTIRDGDNYSYAPRLDVYNKFIAPFVQEWNVVQPVDAATLGLNYYYKDYTTSSFRLVVIDIMYWDADENTWLQNTLADAITNGLDVAIACHYPPSALKKYGTPFQTIQDSVFQSFDVIYGDGMSTTEPILTVQEFIDNGGNFATWIVGHVHDDFVGVLKNYPNQLCIAVTAAACNYQNIYDSAERVRGTKSQDAFNIVGIDTYNKTVKVVRVGSNYDSFMRKKDTMCIKYSEKPELLY